MFNKVYSVLTGTFLAFCLAVPLASAETMPRVVINELMWMGSSTSSSDEWIELRNTTAEAIDLTGWHLTKLSSGTESTMLTIPSGSIPPYGFFVIANFSAETSRLAIEPDLVEADVSLVNSKLQVSLYDSIDALVDRADDGSGNPLAGEYVSGVAWKSMERTPYGADGTRRESWHTAAVSFGFDDDQLEYGTPGAANSNEAPIANVVHPDTAYVGTDVLFDASESTDPENEPLIISWDFGDGTQTTGFAPTHQYQRTGNVTVTVLVSDGVHVTEHQSTIAIVSEDVPIHEDAPQSDDSDDTHRDTPLQTSAFIVVAELYPDPTGRDEEQEFIEVLNAGAEAVNIRGWKLTDTRNDFVIATDTILAPGESIAFLRPLTRIALNNTSDQIFLVDPFGTVINGVAYTKAESGQSFARNTKGRWVWTTPTPNETNTDIETDEESQDDTDGTVKGDSVTVISIADARTLPLRTKVTLRGTVIVLPDVFSTKLFYISDGKQSIGVDIGELDGSFALGSIIEVSGKIGQASGERKINLGSDGSIALIGQGNMVVPQAFSAALPLGSFVTITGTVSSKRGTSIWVNYMGQDVQITAAKGADITWDAVEAGQTVSIVGVLRKSGESTRIYPRSQDDVAVAETPDAASATDGEQKSGTTTLQQRDEVEGRQATHANNPYLGYGLPAVLLGGFGAYTWMKKRKERKAKNPS